MYYFLQTLLAVLKRRMISCGLLRSLYFPGKKRKQNLAMEQKTNTELFKESRNAVQNLALKFFMQIKRVNKQMYSSVRCRHRSIQVNCSGHVNEFSAYFIHSDLRRSFQVLSKGFICCFNFSLPEHTIIETLATCYVFLF